LDAREACRTSLMSQLPTTGAASRDPRLILLTPNLSPLSLPLRRRNPPRERAAALQRHLIEEDEARKRAAEEVTRRRRAEMERRAAELARQRAEREALLRSNVRRPLRGAGPGLGRGGAG